MMETLLELLGDAHGQSALRGNLSHEALKLAAIGSGDYVKSICAALMTIGGKHAPLAQTYDLLTVHDPAGYASKLLDTGKRVPGWGNSFVRGTHDPIWASVASYLQGNEPGLLARINSVTEVLHARGKLVFPNPSCYTAAAGIVLQIPRDVLAFLFIQGRLPEWTAEFVRRRQEP